MKNQRRSEFFILICVAFFLSQDLGAFNISPSRWALTETEIRFSDPDGTMAASEAPGLKDGAWIDETKLAFDRWTGVDNVGFDIIYDSQDCGSTCSISNGTNEIYWMEPGVEPINLPVNALAVTMKRYYDNTFLEVDIVVNKSFDKIAPSTAGLCIAGGIYTNCYDYPSVITHEIGHLFGMDHSSEDPDLPFSDERRQATMYYRLSKVGELGDSLLPLKADDKAGITCMYPDPTYGAPYKVEECCLSYNPFDRAPGCSHSFSGTDDAQSLDSSNVVGGCGILSSLVSNDGPGGPSAPSNFASYSYRPVLYILLFWLVFIFSALVYRTRLALKLVASRSITTVRLVKVLLRPSVLFLFFFTASLYSQSFASPGAYDPVVIPNNDRFDERNSEEAKVGSFYASTNFGYFFAKANDLTKIQNDFKNAGVTGLSPVGGFWGFRVEGGYQNLIDDLDVFAIIGYHFSLGRSGSGDINYGLDTLDSTVSFGLSYIPFLAGARYSFFSNEWVRLGLQGNVGMSLVRGSISINPNQASDTISFSSLNYGGTGLTGELLAFSEWGFYRSFKIGFDVG